MPHKPLRYLCKTTAKQYRSFYFFLSGAHLTGQIPKEMGQTNLGIAAASGGSPRPPFSPLASLRSSCHSPARCRFCLLRCCGCGYWGGLGDVYVSQQQLGRPLLEQRTPGVFEDRTRRSWGNLPRFLPCVDAADAAYLGRGGGEKEHPYLGRGGREKEHAYLGRGGGEKEHAYLDRGGGEKDHPYLGRGGREKEHPYLGRGGGEKEHAYHPYHLHHQLESCGAHRVHRCRHHGLAALSNVSPTVSRAVGPDLAGLAD